MALKDPVKEAQGVLIRQKMAQLGLKQSELALKCGVTQAAISKVLSGDRSPSPELLTKIAAAQGVPVSQLVPGNVTGPNSVSPQPTPADLLPEGVAGFLERHGERLEINARERWYLINSRFRTEAWVVLDDAFWEDVLNFWRTELEKKLDKGGQGAA